jgi:DNA recombination protein RmuC
MDILFLLLGLVVGAALGALITAFFARSGSRGENPALAQARHDAQLSELRVREGEVRANLQSELSAALSTAEALERQVEAQRLQYRELVEQNRSDQVERAERDKRESAVLQALSPVRETLQSMQTKVSELERQRSEQYGSLAEQLKRAQQSDEELRATTESLASALRSNSTRGVWGETQLRRVVEAAGLTQYVDFYTQASLTTDAGAGRPDMVVRLPGNKWIPLDAKVPLEHYLEASQIAVTATGDEGARRAELVGRHVKAMRAHIDALAKKTYWEGLEASPEFVIAFIPSESLLAAALEADPALLDYAFGKRVALASPVNLWAVLKTVAYTWTQQDVSQEARQLFALGTELYERIGTLAGHADDLRRAIERTVDSYNKFAGSLESRVLVSARKFPGIDDTRLEAASTPAVIERSTRRWTAPELLDGLDDVEPSAVADLGEIRERL